MPAKCRTQSENRNPPTPHIPDAPRQITPSSTPHYRKLLPERPPPPVVLLLREQARCAGPTQKDGETIKGNNHNIKVLLVEDHPDTAEILTRLLERRGYRATTAATIAEARTHAQTDWPDVMLVDLALPDGCGADLVHELRATGAGRPVRAVAFSGLAATDSNHQKTASAGFAAYLTKPATLDEVDTAIRRAVADQPAPAR